MNDSGWPMPESQCPKCERWLDRSSSPIDPNSIPKPGDVTICIRCGQISKFNSMLHLERLKRSEFQALPDETKTTLFQMSAAIAQLNGKKIVAVIVDDDEDRPPQGIQMYEVRVKRKPESEL